MVHDLFMTDTADYADIVLPATSQLEQTDLHKAYGHTLSAIQRARHRAAGRGEEQLGRDAAAGGARWATTSRGCARPRTRSSPTCWTHLRQHPRLSEHHAGAAQGRRDRASPAARLGAVRRRAVPHALGQGGAALATRSRRRTGWTRCRTTKSRPSWRQRPPGDERLLLITGASHHFVSSSFANQSAPGGQGADHAVARDPPRGRGAARHHRRRLGHGRQRARGACRLRAVVTDDVRAGVVVSPKGRWLSRNPDGRDVNWTTSDALADLAGQSTFHSNLVEVRVAEAPEGA